jgi:hypothetical protein
MQNPSRAEEIERWLKAMEEAGNHKQLCELLRPEFRRMVDAIDPYLIAEFDASFDGLVAASIAR